MSQYIPLSLSPRAQSACEREREKSQVVSDFLQGAKISPLLPDLVQVIAYWGWGSTTAGQTRVTSN